MAESPFSLPTWEAVDSKRAAGEKLSLLEQFIYGNEPAGTRESVDEWRESLRLLLEWNAAGHLAKVMHRDA